MLTIPANLQARIAHELATIPAIHGKITLTLTFNATINKVLGSMKITRSVEEEIRP